MNDRLLLAAIPFCTDDQSPSRSRRCFFPVCRPRAPRAPDQLSDRADSAGFDAASPAYSIDRKGTVTKFYSTMDVKFELSDYIRVLKMASTPSWNEFSQVSKIAGAGIVLVGIVGFLIYVVMTFVPGGA